MTIIKDLTKRAQRCEGCGNSNIMYFLMKDISRKRYHFHYLYDFTFPQLVTIPHPTEKAITTLICEEMESSRECMKGINEGYELVSLYCWGCVSRGLNKFLILNKFQEKEGDCHYCNKNTYFIKEKRLGMTKGLENMRVRRSR
jgi:hypothetical protein